jgi:hypothetical protein
VKDFHSNGGLSLLLQEATAYLNTFIQPHHLISVSIFEEDHPNKTETHHISILHTGDDSKAYEKKPELIGSIFSYVLIEKPLAQEKLLQETCSTLNKGLESNRYLISTANKTVKDKNGEIDEEKLGQI